MWPYHLRVSVSLPQGLPSRGQGGCRRGGCLPAQVSAIFSCLAPIEVQGVTLCIFAVLKSVEKVQKL